MFLRRRRHHIRPLTTVMDDLLACKSVLVDLVISYDNIDLLHYYLYYSFFLSMLVLVASTHARISKNNKLIQNHVYSCAAVIFLPIFLPLA